MSDKNHIPNTPPENAFYDNYYNTFKIVKADTPELLEDIFRLRYDVYCKENGYINATFHHGGMECDSYDALADHFALIHIETNDTIGTARVVYKDASKQGGFPMQTHCDHPFIHDEKNVKQLCQISRFCMHKDFRRRDGDGTLLPRYTAPENKKGIHHGEMVYLRRSIPYAPLGLFMAAFDAALDNGVRDCLLNIEQSQLQAFNQMGLSYHTLGPITYPHGAMQPVVFNMKNLMDTLLIDNPPCWDIISDRGRLHKRANNQHLNDWQDTIIDTLDWDKVLNAV